MSLHISAAFDSGNIEVVNQSDPADVQLRIRLDVGDQHMQWFHFRAAGVRDTPCVFRLINAHKASYPVAWSGYQAVRTIDHQHYTRVPTRYVDGVLEISDTPPTDLAWYSYFAPYSMQQHHTQLARAQASPYASVDRLGATVDGRDLDRIRVGDAGPVLWVIARQHPGESMAEWWMDGFLKRLLDPQDPAGSRLRSGAQLHIVPNMNPDGSVRGHLRCNAAGANLNRVWHAPTVARSPEVHAVLAAMDHSGVDLCLDVHGDEELPYNFISGGEGIPNWSPRLADLDARFQAAYQAQDRSFQRQHGYPVDAPGEANMTMCTNAVGARFDCCAMTLEMPFKDDANHPDDQVGWSPARSATLGASVIEPLLEVLGALRP
jgi:murein tripeptide amidase MpaA